MEKLTNKKKQYLQNQIVDKNGAYSYLADPTEYKKARKRLQNRESAVRSRQRKKNYQEILEGQIDDQKQEIEDLEMSQQAFSAQNRMLRKENEQLRQQLSLIHGSGNSTNHMI